MIFPGDWAAVERAVRAATKALIEAEPVSEQGGRNARVCFVSFAWGGPWEGGGGGWLRKSHNLVITVFRNSARGALFSAYSPHPICWPIFTVSSPHPIGWPIFTNAGTDQVGLHCWGRRLRYDVQEGCAGAARRPRSRSPSQGRLKRAFESLVRQVGEPIRFFYFSMLCMFSTGTWCHSCRDIWRFGNVLCNNASFGFVLIPLRYEVLSFGSRSGVVHTIVYHNTPLYHVNGNSRIQNGLVPDENPSNS